MRVTSETYIFLTYNHLNYSFLLSTTLSMKQTETMFIEQTRSTPKSQTLVIKMGPPDVTTSGKPPYLFRAACADNEHVDASRGFNSVHKIHPLFGTISKHNERLGVVE